MSRLESESGLDLSVWGEDRAIPRDRLLESVSGVTALLSLLNERVDAELLDVAGPGLRLVANYAVGFDNIDVAACTARGVMVSNTPDVLTDATSDMAMALLLAAARRIGEGDRLVRSAAPWKWGPEWMLGRDLRGAVLGVVGLGRIGRAVAQRATGFGMRIVYSSSRPAPERVRLAGDHDAEPLPLDELLRVSDFVSLHVSLDAETRHLIDAERLALMKPTAVLVNTSRGAVVDEEALARVLEEGGLFAAGLDVYEREPKVTESLLRSDRVVLAPHLGSATVDTRLAMANLAVDNVLAVVRGERPPTLVDPH